MRNLIDAREGPALVATALVHLLPPARRFVLRGDSAARAAAERALGVPVPALACRAGSDGTRAALWLGPAEWLLIAADQDAAAERALLPALEGLAHSLVDVSHRQIGLTVSGAQAATLLNAGCPLDLQLSAFPVGMCTRTLLQKSEIVLWRVAETAFHLEVARSFAPYAWRFLEQAERDL